MGEHNSCYGIPPCFMIYVMLDLSTRACTHIQFAFFTTVILSTGNIFFYVTPAVELGNYRVLDWNHVTCPMSHGGKLWS
jgi:hypothetical protein